MKITVAAAMASLMLIGPLAGMASADQYGQGPQNQQQSHDQSRDQSRDSRHDGRHQWRDQRSDARWDESQHNGYYQGSRWHYGPPTQQSYGQRGFSLGYHPWSRGQRLGYYSTRYQEVDYRSHHLRAPRRGYHWVQDDRGDYLLAAIAGGLIAQVVLNSR